MTTKIFDRYYPILYEESKNSPSKFKMVACLLHNKKLLGRPQCNKDRNACRGGSYGSIHAEAGVLLQYYGKDLSFHKQTNTWSCSCSYSSSSSSFCNRNNRNNKNKNNRNRKKKIDMLVMRISQEDGSPANARPCFNCLRMMNDMGIHRVYYTTGHDKEIICENIPDMFSLQLSYVALKCFNQQALNRNEYFQRIMKDHFPKGIREKNLDYFIKYNYRVIFPPEYGVQYQREGNDYRVYFYDTENVIITWAVVL